MSLKEIENNLDAIFNEMVTPLTNFAFNILKNRYDSQDMVAETFVRIIEYVYINQGLPGRPYYFKVIRNLSIDFLRRKKRNLYMEEIEIQLEQQEIRDVFEEVYEKMTEELLTGLLKSLPERYANIFYLRYEWDLPFAEIASIMEIEEGNARLLYHRAKKKIAMLYETNIEGGSNNEI